MILMVVVLVGQAITIWGLWMHESTMRYFHRETQILIKKLENDIENLKKSL